MSATMKANIARAIRVVLVFTLVFWSSFSVQGLAYAQVSKATIGTVEDHSEDVLTDWAVYEVDPAPADDNKTGLGKRIAKATDDGEVTVALTFAKPGETRDFVAVPTWKGSGEAIDKDKGTVEVINFVKWEVKGDAAAITADKDNPGKATLTSTAAGEVTVTCALSDAAVKKLTLADNLAADEKAAFKVAINEPVPEPVVDVSRTVSILIADESGKLTADSEGKLSLPKTAVDKSYQLDAKASVSTTDSENATTSVDYATVAEARAAGVEITWSFDGETDAAEIDSETGAITFSKEGTATVRVDATVPASEGVEAATGFDVATITVGEGGNTPGGDEPGPEPEPEKKEPVEQGASNPQDTLTIVSNARVETENDSADETSESNNQDETNDSESTDAASSPSGENASTSESSSSSSTSTSSEDEEEGTETIEKTYTVSELAELGKDRATYTMYNGSAFVTVTGEGPDLIAVLKDAGIDDTSQIESLTFENADGATTTVLWADLEDAIRYYPHVAEGNFEDTKSVTPKIALSSLVRGYGDGTGQGEDAAADEENTDESGEGQESSSSSASKESSSSSSASTSASSSSSASTETKEKPAVTDDVELLDNTRFRILFGAVSTTRSIGDLAALSYVDKITVNVKPTEKPPKFDTDISVSVEYVPVPIGAPAVFSALPNTAIRDARFDFTWQVSTNGGKTWKDVPNGNVQVLRVTTTEERIGNQYRVIMETNAKDKNGLENVTVTSKPVTMQEGNGLAVILDYDPPIAGQTAYFKTTLYGEQKGVDIAYTWQQSQDGGKTWLDIPGRTGKTLAVPTEPVDPNAKPAEGDEVVPITYIRVIAEEKSGEKRVAISEAVPLTVHVDDGGSDNPDDQNDNPVKPGDPDPNKPTTDTPSTDKPKKREPKVTEDPNINIEYPEEYTPTAPTDVTPTTPQVDGTEKQQIDPSQLYINEAVNEAVSEQQEAVNDYIEATVPGARWTSLSSAQATGDDVRNILADNPFAPLVIPTGLGITVAGGLEKLLFFRRQTK